MKIEKQLIVNRLGGLLCNDVTNVIKEYCFDRLSHIIIQNEAHRYKRLSIVELSNIQRWRTLNGEQWTLGFHVDSPGEFPNPYFREIGAINCGICGDYVASLSGYDLWNYELRCSERIQCNCEYFDEETQIQEEDYDF